MPDKMINLKSDKPMNRDRKNILILSEADPSNNPRPNRMINWLKNDYRLTVVARQVTGFEDLKSYSLNLVKNSSNPLERLLELSHRIYRIQKQDFGKIIERRIHRLKPIIDQLSKQKFDVIISHDLTLLPIALLLKTGDTKILFDAREYYPRHFEDRAIFKIFKQPLYVYLCNTYLKDCDKIITVSDGLAREYGKEFQVAPEVVMSLPQYFDLNPIPIDPSNIRLVYHGKINPSRRIEDMITMMDYVDSRFSLDIMGLSNNRYYYNKIVQLANKRKNVKIIPPVKMHEIIPFTNQYDIGLYILPQTNFNSSYALPNKFFEFIQARLCLALGPSIEMKKIVDKYDCGIISKSFEPIDLAQCLNQMNTSSIMKYKLQSDIAARSLHEGVNKKRILNMINDLILT
jgi:hypothetical protein